MRACSSLVRLFLRQDLQGPCTGSSHTSVTCLMYVHDWQVTDHVSTCCHLYSAECFGYFPTSLMGKKKKESGEARDFKAIILSPVCPLRHITHKPHVANSHDSSRSTRLDYVITTFQAVHPFRHIHRFLHCPSGSPPGKVRGWNRYQTSSTLVLQT